MTNFIQKMHLDIGFSDFNCLLDSQCSLLTSQILGRCIKLKWSNRAYAVYWLCGTLLCPCLLECLSVRALMYELEKGLRMLQNSPIPWERQNNP